MVKNVALLTYRGQVYDGITSTAKNVDPNKKFTRQNERTILLDVFQRGIGNRQKKSILHDIIGIIILGDIMLRLD